MCVGICMFGDSSKKVFAAQRLWWLIVGSRANVVLWVGIWASVRVGPVAVYEEEVHLSSVFRLLLTHPVHSFQES